MHIQKRPSGYKVTVRLGGGVRKSKTFKVRAAARAWGQQMEAEGPEVAAESAEHTLREALLRYSVEASPKKDGARWELVRLNKFMRELPFVDKPLNEITRDDITKWREASLQTLKGSSVRREMVLLSSVMKQCELDWGWLVSNPMATVKKPPDSPKRERIYTDEEIEAVCEQLTRGKKSQQVRELFLLAIETGMRSGEMVGLTADQVNLETRLIQLEKTKNGTRRKVMMTRAACDLMKARLATVRAANPDTPNPRLYDVSSDSRDVLFRRALKKAGLVGLDFHDSRATAVTRLAKKLDILDLAETIGHRDINSLRSYYRPDLAEVAKRNL